MLRSAHHMSEALRRCMIQQLNSLENSRIYGVVFEKQLNHNPLLQRDMNKLYNYLTDDLAKQITLKDNLVIKIDESNGKQVLRQIFDDYLLKNLKMNSPNKKS